MIAANVMTKNPVTVTVGAKVSEVVSTLRTHCFHDLPVVDRDGRPVGMVTCRAILHAAVPAYASESLIDAMKGGPDLPSMSEHLKSIADKAVDEVMDTKPRLVSADTATSAVAAMLVTLHTDTHNVLVVDEQGKLVGTISALDIVCRMPE